MRTTMGERRGVVVDLAYVDEDDVVIAEPISCGRRLSQLPGGAPAELEPAAAPEVTVKAEVEAEAPAQRWPGGLRTRTRLRRLIAPQWQIWL